MKYVRDIRGHKFGMLEVIEFSHKDKRQSFWVCKCLCGKERIVGRNVFRSVKSCGCSTNYNRKESSMFNRVFRDYKQRARKKKLEFELTEFDFFILISDACYYCETKDSNTKKFQDKTFTYNGIDRLDNKKGYVWHNVVTCCKKCNVAKAEMNKEQFVVHILDIYYSLKNRGMI